MSILNKATIKHFLLSIGLVFLTSLAHSADNCPSVDTLDALLDEAKELEISPDEISHAFDLGIKNVSDLRNFANSTQHKQVRREIYIQRKADEGEVPWEYLIWSKNYDLNQVRHSKARVVQLQIKGDHGWEADEVSITLPDGSIRRADLADNKLPENVNSIGEVKTGYVSRNAKILEQIRKDKYLQDEEGMTITWYIDGYATPPLLAELADAKFIIKYTPRPRP